MATGYSFEGNRQALALALYGAPPRDVFACRVTRSGALPLRGTAAAARDVNVAVDEVALALTEFHENEPQGRQLMFALNGNFAQASLSTAKAHDAAVYRLLHLANQQNCAQHRMEFLLCTVEYWTPGPECSEQGGDCGYEERWRRVTDETDGVLQLELAAGGAGALCYSTPQEVEQGGFTHEESYRCEYDRDCWHRAPNTIGRSMDHSDGSEEMELGVLSYLVALSETWFKAHEILLACRAGPATAVARLRAAMQDPQNALSVAEDVFRAWQQHPRSSLTQGYWWREEYARLPRTEQHDGSYCHTDRLDKLLTELIGFVEHIGDTGLMCVCLGMLEGYHSVPSVEERILRRSPGSNVPATPGEDICHESFSLPLMLGLLMTHLFPEVGTTVSS